MPITAQLSKPRLPIASICAALLAIVAAVSLAQRLHGVRHRYEDVDFSRDYGWWTVYSTGGDPWQVLPTNIELRPGVERPRFCNYTPFFVEGFSPLARLHRKARVLALAVRADAVRRRRRNFARARERSSAHALPRPSSFFRWRCSRASSRACWCIAMSRRCCWRCCPHHGSARAASARHSRDCRWRSQRC